MEESTALLHELKNILTNLKKSPTRRYKRTTLKNKLTKSRDIYSKLIEKADNLTGDVQTDIVKQARSVFFDITTFLNDRLQFKTLIPFSTLSKIIITFQSLYRSVRKVENQRMAKVDVRLGTSLVPVYDGNPDQLDSFIESVQLFTELTNNDNGTSTVAIQQQAKDLTFRFIKTRLTGVAHQAVTECSDVESLILILKRQCQSKENSDSLTLKIKTLKQTGQISDFCTQIENMCVQLKNAYIKETIPSAKANEMSTKVGVSSLIDGIKDPTTKLILKAGNFSNINSAVQKVLENSTNEQNNHQQIFFTSQNSRFNVNRKNNYNNQRNRNFNRQNNYRNNNSNSSYNRNNRNGREFEQTNNRNNNNDRNRNYRNNNKQNIRQNNHRNSFNNNNFNNQQRVNGRVMVANAADEHSFFQEGTEPSIQ